jgi:hypothetical protein
MVRRVRPLFGYAIFVNGQTDDLPVAIFAHERQARRWAEEHYPGRYEMCAQIWNPTDEHDVVLTF